MTPLNVKQAACRCSSSGALLGKREKEDVAKEDRLIIWLFMQLIEGCEYLNHAFYFSPEKDRLFPLDAQVFWMFV